MPRIAVRCPNRFHDEVEGSESVVLTDVTVADQAEADELVATKREIHARCYCGHATTVTARNLLLVDE